jgi:drug/metabolite transporter (DMT)-like permease
MRIRKLLEIVLLGSLVGPSFVFIKLGVAEMSPFTLVAGRISLAAIVLFTLLKLRRGRLPPWGAIWGHLAVSGFFSAGLPFLLFAFGELHVTSALAGVINGFTPIVTAILAHFLISDERLDLSRTLGVGIGVGGFALLLFPELLKSSINGDPSGVMLIGLAACSYAIAMVYNRKFLRHLPSLVAPTGGLLIASCYLIPLALIFAPFSQTAPLTYKGVIAVLELSLIGTSCFFALYYRILRTSGATFVAMSNYLLPFFGTLLGVFFLHERISWTSYLAAGFIVLGMMFVNGTLKLPSRKPSTSEPEPIPIPIDNDDPPTD